MAIVERQTTTRTTHHVDAADSDAGTGILVVLAIVVALAAAYFAYDYYATPGMDPMATGVVTTQPVTNPNPATVPAE